MIRIQKVKHKGMLLFRFMIFIGFACLLYAAPEQDLVPGGVPVQEGIAQDSMQLLANEWVLREELRKDGDIYTPVLPFDSLTLVLFDDHTYKLIRPTHMSVEWQVKRI